MSLERHGNDKSDEACDEERGMEKIHSGEFAASCGQCYHSDSVTRPESGALMSATIGIALEKQLTVIVARPIIKVKR